MKKMFIIYCVVFLTVGLAHHVHAGAGNRVGTGGAAELLIPTGTRDIGMGGSTIATASGIEALFWNPAGVAKMSNGAALYVSHMNYIADIGVDYGAVSALFEGFGVVSLSLKSLSIGEIAVTTADNPDGTGQTFAPQFFTVGLSYSRQLSDRIAVGVTTHLISERMANVSATGVAFSVGVQYDNVGSVNGLSAGVAVKNIGPQMKFDGPGLNSLASVPTQNRGPSYVGVRAASFELPSTIEFGLGYKTAFAENNSILFASTFQNNNFSDDEYKLGAEYSYQDLFFVRGGYSFAQEESESRDYIFGGSAGAGIHTQLGSLDLTFDYAFRSAKFLENNHVFSVKLGF